MFGYAEVVWAGAGGGRELLIAPACILCGRWPTGLAIVPETFGAAVVVANAMGGGRGGASDAVWRITAEVEFC